MAGLLQVGEPPLLFEGLVLSDCRGRWVELKELVGGRE